MPLACHHKRIGGTARQGWMGVCMYVLNGLQMDNFGHLPLFMYKLAEKDRDQYA